MFSFFVKVHTGGLCNNNVIIVKLFHLARQLLLIMSSMKGVSGREERM